MTCETKVNVERAHMVADRYLLRNAYVRVRWNGWGVRGKEGQHVASPDSDVPARAWPESPGFGLA